MSRPLRNERWLRFFSSIFYPGDAGAVLLADGTALHIQYQELADLGTLPRVGQTIGRYFQMKPGDTLLLNDPQAGGSTLSHLSFIQALTVEPGSSKTDLILVLKQAIRPHFVLAKSVEEEGLRIPPTPIADANGLHTSIAEAISQSPGAPADLLSHIELGYKRILSASQRAARALKSFDLQLNKSSIANYLAGSRVLAKNSLQEFSLGETELTVALDPTTRIRLRLEITDKRVLFDFSGTQDCTWTGLTDAATLGACMGALSASLPRFPLNSGAFDLVEVVTPSGSLLNASHPRPTLIGVFQLAPLVAELALKAIGQISSRHQGSMSSPTRLLLSLVFPDGRVFFDDVLPGTGASEKSSGESGLLSWRRSQLQPSVEEVEKRFPLLILRNSRRESSGGRGLKAGGDGLIRSYKLLEPAVTTWSAFPSIAVEGIQGGGPGDPAIVEIQLPGEPALPTEIAVGSRELPAGTILNLFSGGGGGYGRRST